MSKFAVMVDAGYLFGQGSVPLAGRNLGRTEIHVNPMKLVSLLRRKAAEVSEATSLLRVYWYDAVPRSGPTGMQNYIAMANDIKFRAGNLIRGHEGALRQKGVDTLIVVDMIELAQSRAVSDLILVTGDDDLRIGVQTAQRVGARVNLLGIAPASRSQSHMLRREADALFELNADEISEFMSLVPDAQPVELPSVIGRQEFQHDEVRLSEVIKAYLNSYPIDTWREVHSSQIHEFTVPWVDTRLLECLHQATGRSLVGSELRDARRQFRNALDELVSQP